MTGESRSPRVPRIVLAALVVLAPSCALFHEEEPYAAASPSLKEEIDRLVNDLQYQHGKELLQTNQRLIYIGEPAIPALLQALSNSDPLTRANACFVLGEIRDRRVVPRLGPLLKDEDTNVRYEAAASLVVLGDWEHAMPLLLNGLRDPDKWTRFKAFTVLKNATRQDFGYDYQAEESAREESVRRFEQWWEENGTAGRPRS